MAPAKAVLIIGASGALGGLLARRLVAGGRRVFGTWRTHCPWNGDGIFERLDRLELLDPKNVRAVAQRVLKDCDEVIFCAGAIGDEGGSDFRVNDVGIENLLPCMDGVRITYCSSIAVYDGLSDGAVGEGTCRRAATKYGRSKIRAEDLLLQSRSSYVILRPSIIYGAEFAARFTCTLRALIDGDVRVVDGGKNLVPFIAGADLANAILAVLASSRSRECFNLCSGHVQQSEYLAMLAEVAGVPAPGQASLDDTIALAEARLRTQGGERSLPLVRRALRAMSRSRRICTDRAKEMLSWEPRVTLADAILETYRAWHLGRTMDQRHINATLRGVLERSRKIVRVGVPQIGPSAQQLRYIAEFAEVHSNNQGTPTRSVPEPASTRFIEAEVIDWVRTLLHDRTADGHLCAGATEANLLGLWIARERLARGRPVSVVAHAYAHYSIEKACRVLGLELLTTSAKTWREGLEGQLEPLLARSAGRPIVVVATVGHTASGIVDDVGRIAEVLRRTKLEHTIHVDAAMGGLVLPFFASAPVFDFRVGPVASIALDFHKLGHGPYPSGVFLCRRGMQDAIARKISYVGALDDTIAGSRPGYVAPVLWSRLNELGSDGFKEHAQRLLDVKRLILQQVPRSVPVITSRWLPVFAILAARRIPTNLEKEYRLHARPQEWRHRNAQCYTIHVSDRIPARVYEEVIGAIVATWRVSEQYL